MKTKRKSNKEIDVTNFNQLRNTAMAFGVTEQVVKDAVGVVGNSLDAIQVHLKAFRNPYINRTKRGRL